MIFQTFGVGSRRMSSSPPNPPGERYFVLVASLVGAAGGSYWLGLVVLVLATPACSTLDLGAGVVALTLLCLLEISLEVWGTGRRRAQLLFTFAAVLGALSAMLL